MSGRIRRARGYRGGAVGYSARIDSRCSGPRRDLAAGGEPNFTRLFAKVGSAVRGRCQRFSDGLVGQALREQPAISASREVNEPTPRLPLFRPLSGGRLVCRRHPNTWASGISVHAETRTQRLIAERGAGGGHRLYRAHRPAPSASLVAIEAAGRIPQNVRRAQNDGLTLCCPSPPPPR